MELSDKQKKVLKDLGELLTFGYSILASTEIKISQRLKRVMLFHIMGTTQSYAEAVLKLIRPENIYDKSAEVLMRSLIESFINLNYMYCGRDEKNVRNFIMDEIAEKIKFSNRYKNFLTRHPSWTIEFGHIKTITDWQAFDSNLTKQIDKISKRYKQNFKSLNLIDRAIAIDKHLESGGKLTKSNSLEYYYVTYYSYFSDVAHLGGNGLSRFFNQDEWKFDIDGKPEDMERVALITYQLYYVILRFFAKKFGVYDKNKFSKYEKVSRSLVGK